MIFGKVDAAVDAWQHALDSLAEKDARVLRLLKALRHSLVRVGRDSSDDACDSQSSGASSSGTSTCDSDSIE